MVFGGNGLGMPSPQYVRSAKFVNNLPGVIDVEVVFESGNDRSYKIQGNDEAVVQGEIDHKGWKEVDPIVSFKV